MKLIMYINLLLSPFLLLAQSKEGKRFGVGFSMNTTGISAGVYPLDNQDLYANQEASNFCIGLDANYLVSPKFLIRLKCSKSQRKVTQSSSNDDFTYLDSLARIEATGYSRYNQVQRDILFSLSLLYRHNINKFSISCGIDLNFINHGEKIRHQQILSELQNTFSYSENIIIWPKGKSFGFGGILGINYFLRKWVSIGCEYSPSVYFSSFGDLLYQKNVRNNNGSNFVVEYNQKITYNLFHSDMARGSLFFTFWF